MKEFLHESGVAYTEHDITEEEDAFRKLEEMGAFSTPVVVVDGEVVIGFNRGRLQALLDR